MRFLIASLFSLATAAAWAVGPEPLWTVEGFASPESAVYSPARGGVIYVSNVNGEDVAKDGNGFISLLSADGKMIKRAWKTGLNAPKGLAVKGGLLYVADIDELLEIDTGNLRVLRRFKAAGAKFLNDVTVSGDTVYVSDMVTNVIWRLSGNRFEAWLSDAALENPNGLLVQNGQLIVGSWGVMKEDFSTETPGYLKAVDLASRSIRPLHAPIALGNLDGVIADGKGGATPTGCLGEARGARQASPEPGPAPVAAQAPCSGLIVSDWMNGNVFKVSATGEVRLWLLLEQGTADIGAIPGKAVLVPNQSKNTLTAYPMP